MGVTLPFCSIPATSLLCCTQEQYHPIFSPPACMHASHRAVSHDVQVWEGKNAVLTGRKMIGATNPQVSSSSRQLGWRVVAAVCVGGLC